MPQNWSAKLSTSRISKEKNRMPFLSFLPSPRLPERSIRIPHLKTALVSILTMTTSGRVILSDGFNRHTLSLAQALTWLERERAEVATHVDMLDALMQGLQETRQHIGAPGYKP